MLLLNGFDKVLPLQALLLRERTEGLLQAALLALLVLHLVRDGIVVAELARELRLHGLPLLVVEQGLRERHAEEEPRVPSNFPLVALSWKRFLRKERKGAMPVPVANMMMLDPGSSGSSISAPV